MKTDDPSYLMRIDKATGRTVWKVNRPTNAVSESPDSYTTPALARYANVAEIVVTGGDVVTGHDPATGREVWRADGLNPTNDRNYRIIASPVVVGDVIIAPTRQRPMLALKTGGRGDVTSSHKLWEFNNGPDVPTPTSDGKYLYVVNDGGVVYCLDLETGTPAYGPARLKPGTYSASPTLADGRLYITSEEGMASVFAAGPKFQILAENAMDEYTLSSIAVSNGQLFLRTEKHLYAIGAGSSTSGGR
jgi:outer membrane protein assembly factor BamB